MPANEVVHQLLTGRKRKFPANCANLSSTPVFDQNDTSEHRGYPNNCIQDGTGSSNHKPLLPSIASAHMLQERQEQGFAFPSKAQCLEASEKVNDGTIDQTPTSDGQHRPYLDKKHKGERTMSSSPHNEIMTGMASMKLRLATHMRENVKKNERKKKYKSRFTHGSLLRYRYSNAAKSEDTSPDFEYENHVRNDGGSEHNFAQKQEGVRDLNHTIKYVQNPMLSKEQCARRNARTSAAMDFIRKEDFTAKMTIEGFLKQRRRTRNYSNSESSSIYTQILEDQDLLPVLLLGVCTLSYVMEWSDQRKFEESFSRNPLVKEMALWMHRRQQFEKKYVSSNIARKHRNALTELARFQQSIEESHFSSLCMSPTQKERQMNPLQDVQETERNRLAEITEFPSEKIGHNLTKNFKHGNDAENLLSETSGQLQFFQVDTKSTHVQPFIGAHSNVCSLDRGLINPVKEGSNTQKAERTQKCGIKTLPQTIEPKEVETRATLPSVNLCQTTSLHQSRCRRISTSPNFLNGNRKSSPKYIHYSQVFSVPSVGNAIVDGNRRMEDVEQNNGNRRDQSSAGVIRSTKSTWLSRSSRRSPLLKQTSLQSSSNGWVSNRRARNFLRDESRRLSAPELLKSRSHNKEEKKKRDNLSIRKSLKHPGGERICSSTGEEISYDEDQSSERSRDMKRKEYWGGQNRRKPEMVPEYVSPSRSLENLDQVGASFNSTMPPGYVSLRDNGKKTEKSAFIYEEVIRGKQAREALRGYECEECAAFFDKAVLHGNGSNFYERDELLRCSRHRRRHTPPSTPQDFWELSFIDEKKKSVETTQP